MKRILIFTFFCMIGQAIGSLAIAQTAAAPRAAAPAGAGMSDGTDWQLGAFYGVNEANPLGGESGVTIKGEQGSEYGLMLWIPLLPGWIYARTAASYKTLTKKYTDTILYPTSTFTVNETTYDGALGLQFDVFWDIYVFAEGKVSLPTDSTVNVVTPGGNVQMKPVADFLQAYGIGYDLFDFWGMHFCIEAEYDKGSKIRPLGETNSYYSAQAFLNFGF